MATECNRKQSDATGGNRDKPLSLYGMTPEQALAKALSTPMPKKSPAKQVTKKPAK